MEEKKKIKELEDIIAWQEARTLLKIIYELTDTFPKSEEYNFKKHMRECVRNIPGNIAEGFGRFNYQECMQFYRIARGSLNELKSDLYCTFDLSYYDSKKFDLALTQTGKVSKLLNGLIKSTVSAKFLKK